MAFCSNCGKELKVNYNFCPGCGMKIIIENDSEEEKFYDDVFKYVIDNNKASASLIQKEFNVSYNKASKIIDLLEERGVVGPQNGNKPREVLINNDNVTINKDNFNGSKNNFETNVKSKIDDIMDTPDTTYIYDKKDIKDNMLLAVLSYLGFLVFIPYFVNKDSKFVKYHAVQGMNLLICWGIYTIVDNLLSLIKVSKVVVEFGGITGTRMVTPLWVSLPINIVGASLIAFSIIGVVYVCQGKAKELPLIGKLKIVK